MEKQEKAYKGVIEYFKNRIMAGSQPQFRSGSAADHGYDGSDFLPAGIGELHHL